jgi:SagB-type dehydrogenase family enzyme
MNEEVPDSLLVDAVYKNSSRALSPSFNATGLRTNDIRFRSLGLFPQVRVAEDFLLNSRFVRDDAEAILSVQEYFRDSSILMLSEAANVPTSSDAVALPKSPKMTMSVENALRSRRSTRAFTGDAAGFDSIGALLRCGAGMSAVMSYELEQGARCELKMRNAPSAGGLYPIDCILVALNVKKLDSGIYTYNSAKDSLDPHIGRIESILASISVPEDVIAVSQASCLIILVAQFWRSMRKYGARGTRFIFHEAGAISQNIHLGAVTLGLATTDNASYYDDELDEALGCDGLHRSAIHMIVVGSAG